MAKPWQSYEEYQVDLALQSAIDAPENLRKWEPRVLFPDHRGVVKAEPNIYDIMGINRYGASNNAYLSGFPVRRSSNLIDDSWSGSSRYSMDALG
jgi:hypothetical protein